MNAISAVRLEGMKRWLGLAGALALATGALLILLATLQRPLVAKVQAGEGHVDGTQGQDIEGCGAGGGYQACRTIQYAIDSTPYDVLWVTEGTYTESVLIHRDLTLRGGWNVSFTVWNPISYETTILGPTGSGVYAVTVATATTALLDGLTVLQGDDGVHLHASAGARLVNLKVRDTDDEGIESNGAWLVVSNTEVFDTGDNGILVETGRAEIYSSTVHHTGLVGTYQSRRGIYLRGDGPDAISHTLVYSTADDGIYVRDADRGTLVNNRVYSATTDGIQVRDLAVALVHSNTVSATGKDGFRFRGSGVATFLDNVVHDVADEGFQIEGRGSVTLENNLVYRTGAAGILAENAGGTALIQNNTLYSTTGLAADGIHVNPGVVATVKSNTVYSMTDDAIDFKGSSGVIGDNQLYAVGDVGVQVSNTVSISVARNEIYDVAEAGIRVGNTGTALIVHNAVSRTVTGTAAIYVGAGVAATIDHNSVYSAAADGINFRGTVGLIRYNEIHRVGDQGINVNADDTTVVGNTVYDTQNEGLRVRSGSTVLVQGNTIYNVLGDTRDGIHIEPNVVATIVANQVYGAADDGIAFNGSVGTISENYLHLNGASGIDVDADAVTIAANRIFSNGGAGIELEQAGRFTATNNLIGENVAGGVLALGPVAGRLVNNTLVGHPSSPIGVGVHVLSHTVRLTSANNIIVSHTTGLSVTAGAWVTTTYDDVWNNSVNFSGIVGGAGVIQQHPLLADVTSRDYHLLWGSPCIDAGWEPLALEFPFDFEGHPRAGRIEIGADEVGLLVTKEAPTWARPGALITYTITVSNYYYDITLTQVVVTDAVPSGAYWVSAQHGGSLLTDDVVSWTIDSITPTGGAAQVGFVVTATATITNDRYRVVTSTQGVSSDVGPAVVTMIEWRLYLPVVLKDHE